MVVFDHSGYHRAAVHVCRSRPSSREATTSSHFARRAMTSLVGRSAREGFEDFRQCGGRDRRTGVGDKEFELAVDRHYTHPDRLVRRSTGYGFA